MNYGIYQVELFGNEHYEYWREYLVENDYNYIEMVQDAKCYLDENGGGIAYILYDDEIIQEIER